MLKLSTLRLGIIIAAIIIIIAIIVTWASYYYSSDLESDDNDQDDKKSDVEPEVIDELYLNALVVVDNEIPNLTVAIIFENAEEIDVSISGSWNLTQENNSEILDSGEEMVTILADTNDTHTVQPITDYIGSVVFEYSANGLYDSVVFNTTIFVNTTENETEEPSEDNETSNGDEDSNGDDGQSGGGGGGGAPPAPSGSYTGFNEFDPNGSITFTKDRITFTELARDHDGSIYKDMGTGYFGSTFTHKFQFKVTSDNKTLEGTFMPWSVCNEISTYHQFRYGADCIENNSDDHVGLALTIHPKGQEDITLSNESENITEPHGNIRDWTFGSAGHFVIPDEDFFGKMIYVTITRSNGYLVVVLYRDSSRTDIIDSASTLTGPDSYDIIQGLAARGARPCAPWYSDVFNVSGYVEALKLG